MTKKSIIVGLVLVSIFVRPSEAEVGTATVFLMFSPGARASALGDAFVAITDDAAAVFYNPASIALRREFGENQASPWSAELFLPWPNGLFGARSRYMPVFDIPDLSFTSYALVQNTPRWGTFAVSSRYLNVGDIMETDSQGYEVGTSHVYDLSIGLSYGIKVSPSMSLGATLNYVRSVLHPETGTGTVWAVDLGWLYRLPDYAPTQYIILQGPVIGVSISNIGPGISYEHESESDPLPALLRVGLVQEILVPQYARLLVTAQRSKIMVNWHGDAGDDWREELREGKWGIGAELELRLPFDVVMDLGQIEAGFSLFFRKGHYKDREASNVPEGDTFGRGGGIDFRLREGAPKWRMRFDYGEVEPPRYLGRTNSDYYSFTISML